MCVVSSQMDQDETVSVHTTINTQK